MGDAWAVWARTEVEVGEEALCVATADGALEGRATLFGFSRGASTGRSLFGMPFLHGMRETRGASAPCRASLTVETSHARAGGCVGPPTPLDSAGLRRTFGKVKGRLCDTYAQRDQK